MSNQISTQCVSFYGSQLITLKVEDVIYTAVRPIVEALGLSWGTQQRKLESSKNKFNCTHMNTVAEDGKSRQMLCMPLKKLNGWLFSINPEKVRADIKDKVIKYQEECFEALYNYWFNGKAERPMPMPKKTLELTWQNIHSLAWLWFSHGRMLNLLSELSPALQNIRSDFSPTVYSHVHEYRHLYQEVEPIMKTLLSEFKIDTYNQHGLNRVLQELQTQPMQRLSKR